MHINAFLQEIAWTWLLITRGFRGRPIQKRHFWLQRFKGRFHNNQVLAKIGKNITKGHNFNCIWHTYAEFGFEIGFVLSVNSSVTLSYTMDKGTIIAINTFLRETAEMWLIITGSLRGRSMWRRRFWLQISKACQPNFGQNRLKSRKLCTNLTYMWYLPFVHFRLIPCKLIGSNSTLAYERKTAKINVKNSKV